MSSPQLRCITPARPVSTSPSFGEQIKIQKLTQEALRVWIIDRVDEHLSKSTTLLRSAREHQSPADLRAALAALARAREQLDPVLGPLRVKTLPAQR